VIDIPQLLEQVSLKSASSLWKCYLSSKYLRTQLMCLNCLECLLSTCASAFLFEALEVEISRKSVGDLISLWKMFSNVRS
ncbi:hypothetical protein HN51_012507, partial [Arachis hypogaea]